MPVVSLLKPWGGGQACDAFAFEFKSIVFSWYRSICFSADNFAVCYTGSIKDGVNAILMTIFNDRSLVDEIHLKSYLNHISEIESCRGPMAMLEILNEALPYGPYRVLNLLQFFMRDSARELLTKFHKAM